MSIRNKLRTTPTAFASERAQGGDVLYVVLERGKKKGKKGLACHLSSLDPGGWTSRCHFVFRFHSHTTTSSLYIKL